MEVPPWGQELGLAARVCGPGSCPGPRSAGPCVSACVLLWPLGVPDPFGAQGSAFSLRIHLSPICPQIGL